jgi:hypothetical protein
MLQAAPFKEKYAEDAVLENCWLIWFASEIENVGMCLSAFGKSFALTDENIYYIFFFSEVSTGL